MVEPEDRTESVIVDLVARMPLEWKVGQLNQRLHGWEAIERTSRGLVLTDMAKREIDRWGGLGALYGLFRADPWSGRHWTNGIRPEERAEVAALVQETVRTTDPQGVGVLIVEEAPHGHQALGGPALPVNLTQGATWDPDAVRRAARAVGQGMRASGIHVALVSGLDLLRDPRWGRSEECFSEVPLLASAMVRAVVEGMQGRVRSRVSGAGVAVVAKHLAAQGAAQGGRNARSATIGSRELREVHLPPVRAAVEAGVLGVMAAYNDIDGVPCCASPWLLEDYLRGELGFDGVVMADGLAVDQLLPMVGSVEACGRTALLAGVDLSLWDKGFTTLVDSAREDPRVAAAVDRSLTRVLTLKAHVGLLPGAAAGAADARHTRRGEKGESPSAIDLNRHRGEAESAGRDLAREGLVLLTDSGVLPLNPVTQQRIAVVGPNADDLGAQLGDYVAPPADGTGTTVAAGLRALFSDEGASLSGQVVPGWDESWVSVSGTRTTALDRRAVAEADVVVVVLGGTSERFYTDAFAENGALARGDAKSGQKGWMADCGEGVDLASLALPDGQDELLEQVAELARGPVVAVVIAGRPHVLTHVVQAADAVVWAGYPGPDGGRVIAEALTGATRIAGALPFTLPSSDGVAPVTDDERTPAGGAYQDVPRPVLFPLGFGLGQRVIPADALEAGELSRDADGAASAGGGEEIGGSACGGRTFTAHLTNTATGTRERVVVLWAHRMGGITVPRGRELIGFQRVVLKEGESREVRWTLPEEVLFAEGSGPGAETIVSLDDRQVVIRR